MEQLKYNEMKNLKNNIYSDTRSIKNKKNKKIEINPYPKYLKHDNQMNIKSFNLYNSNNTNINSYNFNNRANNTMPNGFGYTGGPNNYKKNSSNNSSGITRPSTAPHKDKEKMIKNNKNNYQNNNYGRMPLRHNQRPSSAGGKNKNLYGNNYNNNINNRIGIGLGKNLSNANMNTKNRKKKTY